MSDEKRKEIGYVNGSDGTVIPGYDSLFHTLSKTQDEVNSEGKVVHGGFHFDLKGQFLLDQEKRGGKRLWQRIYAQADLEKLMESKGTILRNKAPQSKEPSIDEAFA